MKIASFRTRLLYLPAEEPLADSLPDTGRQQSFVTLEMTTDEGVAGVGVTFVPDLEASRLTGALRMTVDEVAGMTVGEDPMEIEGIVQRLDAAFTGAGPGGLLAMARAAVDMALWDIKGKALGQPVASLLGGCRRRVPAYASGALMRPVSPERLAEIGPMLVEKGFRQMKTQMGGEALATREVERIRALREAVGDDIDLMCDINQAWSVNRAIDVGRRVEEYHLFWLEDVVAHDDYQGMAKVADALHTPIAAGEYVYGIGPFRQMVENGSVDVVMIDLVRVGGITPWRKVAAMAEAFNLPVVSHLFPEIHIQLMAAIPNGLTVEYMPWSLRLWEETPVFSEGCLEVPDKPGLGLAFDQEALRHFAVD